MIHKYYKQFKMQACEPTYTWMLHKHVGSMVYIIILEFLKLSTIKREVVMNNGAILHV